MVNMKTLGTAREPSSFNGYERLQAISPVLSRAMELHARLLHESPSEARNQSVAAGFDAVYGEAAQQAGVEPEVIQRWTENFMAAGKPGLSAPVKLSAAEVADGMRGTWELTSRFHNGGNTVYASADGTTPTRSRIYHEVEPGQTNGKMLITMWTDENHYPREWSVVNEFKGMKNPEKQTFLMIAWVEWKLRNIDDHTVEWTNDGELVGNFAHYRQPKKVYGRNVLTRQEETMAMVGIPESMWVDDSGTRTPVIGRFLLVKAAGAPDRVVYHEQGFPAMHGNERTLDEVDTYVRISSENPLIAGWEPIQDYYNRMKNPGARLQEAQGLMASGEQVHLFFPADRDALRKYAILQPTTRALPQFGR
jgi:hypothetical protein